MKKATWLLENLQQLKTSLKWIVFAALSGTSVGLVSALFHFCLAGAARSREERPWLIWLLPFGGLLIVASYRLLQHEKDTGTNLVLSSIHSGHRLPLRMAPLIFLSTLITHLLGGSAGREGAALQLGGSIGSAIGRRVGFDEKDKNIMTMCSMSAAFSALFGTPMAAAIFSLEVVSVGIMHYAALVPCVIAALIACAIASRLGVPAEAFPLDAVPPLTVGNGAWIIVLASLCALLSILFCVLLHQSERLYHKFFPNPYLRIFAGGCIVLLLTLLTGSQRYNGSGIELIVHCMEGNAASPEMSVLKMLFTAATLGPG